MCQLEHLQLYCKRVVLDLNDLSGQENLKKLDLAGAKSLDLAPLRYLTGLRQLVLSDFAFLDNLRALEYLPRLESLVVEDVREVSDPFVLDMLNARGVKVWAIGTTSWSKGVRQRIDAERKATGIIRKWLAN